MRSGTDHHITAELGQAHRSLGNFDAIDVEQSPVAQHKREVMPGGAIDRGGRHDAPAALRLRRIQYLQVGSTTFQSEHQLAVGLVADQQCPCRLGLGCPDPQRERPARPGRGAQRR